MRHHKCQDTKNNTFQDELDRFDLDDLIDTSDKYTLALSMNDKIVIYKSPRL